MMSMHPDVRSIGLSIQLKYVNITEKELDNNVQL